MSDPASTVSDSSISDAELIALLRKRLYEVEEAAEHYILIITQTGALREEAHKKMIAALTTDFKTAILCSHDMTDEQRAFWLAEIAKGNTTDVSEAPQ